MRLKGPVCGPCWSGPLNRDDPHSKPYKLYETRRDLPSRKFGWALLVVHEGKSVDERYWRGHEGSDWTNSASMAKTMCSLLVGIAVDEGHIASIDEPAANWLPAWRADRRKAITLRHLLGMH